jgi:hypothetical protein
MSDHNASFRDRLSRASQAKSDILAKFKRALDEGADIVQWYRHVSSPESCAWISAPIFEAFMLSRLLCLIAAAKVLFIGRDQPARDPNAVAPATS